MGACEKRGKLNVCHIFGVNKTREDLKIFLGEQKHKQNIFRKGHDISSGPYETTKRGQTSIWEEAREKICRRFWRAFGRGHSQNAQCQNQNLATTASGVQSLRDHRHISEKTARCRRKKCYRWRPTTAKFVIPSCNPKKRRERERKRDRKMEGNEDDWQV